MMKLEWQQNPPKELMTWYRSMEYAETLGDGWRLPTRAELVDAYDNNVEGFIEDSYWSSNEYVGYDTDAWFVNFERGDVYDHHKTNNKYVRCVREDKGERWKPYTEGYNIEGDYYVHALPPGFKNERFRTKELARLRQKQIEAENELFNIWEHLVGDWRPDWSDNKNLKYCVEYHRGNIKVNANFSVSDRSLYRFFPTEELARRQYEIASAHARAYIRGEF